MAYVNPIPAGAAGKAGDSGRDYQGTVGSYVVAPADGTVTYAGAQSGFGQAVYFQIKGGPKIYIGHAKPVVQTGAFVRAGKPLSQLVKNSGGTASSLPGWFEIGIASKTINAPMFHGQGHSPNTEGSKAIESLIRGAAAPTAPTGGTDTAPTPPGTNVDTTGAPVGTDDPAIAAAQQQIPQLTGPALSSPSLAGDYAQQQATTTNPGSDTWQMIAANGSVSPETLRLAQLAGYGGNAAPSG